MQARSFHVAIGVWGLLLNEFNAWAATVNLFTPYALFLAIVQIAATMHLLSRRRGRPAEGDQGRQ
jgi:hypothetical protein